MRPGRVLHELIHVDIVGSAGCSAAAEKLRAHLLDHVASRLHHLAPASKSSCHATRKALPLHAVDKDPFGVFLSFIVVIACNA